jgi:assimilatory nitrate reductase catalytic subunit
VDPISGEPEFKHTPVSIAPFGVAWHGFVLATTALGDDALVQVAHWSKIRGAGFIRYELAGRAVVADQAAFARSLLGVVDAQADWIDYHDRAGGIYRAVHLVDGRMAACLFLSPRPDLPARAWLAGLFAREVLSVAERAALLSGQALQGGLDAGVTVCSCFGVGRNTICAAIAREGLTTVAAVTACVKAGGNCGSCVPEIRQLLQQGGEALRA